MGESVDPFSWLLALFITNPGAILLYGIVAAALLGGLAAAARLLGYDRDRLARNVAGHATAPLLILWASWAAAYALAGIGFAVVWLFASGAVFGYLFIRAGELKEEGRSGTLLRGVNGDAYWLKDGELSDRPFD